MNKSVLFTVLIFWTLMMPLFSQSLSQVAKQLESSKKAYHLSEISFLTQESRADLLEKYSDRITTAEYYSVDWGAYQAILDEKPKLLSFDIPSPSGTIKLEVFKVKLHSDNYRLVDGNGQKLSSRKSCFYRGTLAGDPTSIVTVSFYENDFDLVVWGGQDFRIDQVENNVFSRYHEKNIKTKVNPARCLNDEFEIKVPTQEGNVVLRGANSGNYVELYIECDYSFYESTYFNVNNAEAFVNSLYNEVGTIYNNESIPLKIDEIKIWTSSASDPYSELSLGGSFFNKFLNEINDTKPNKICTLLSFREFGWGLSAFNELCTRYSIVVCTDLDNTVVPFPTYSWNVFLITHEMGHVFGANHTHACVWNGNNTPIDDCGSQYYVTNTRDDDHDNIVDEVDEAWEAFGCFDDVDNIIPEKGTVMSYCNFIRNVGIDLALGFGKQPGDFIRDKYNNAPCSTGAESVPLDIDFDVRKHGKGANLIWKAQSAPNVEGFEMYRSENGDFWEAIGRVNLIGSGTQKQDYLFFDAFPLVGINYYRIRQNDFDGYFKFTETRTITFDNLTAKPSFHPNPANEFVSFSFIPASGLDIQILDPLGRVLLAQKVSISDELDISYFSKGVYWVRFGQAERVDYQMLVVK